ncbi:MAG: hypothetical protein EON52_21900, partial [Actinomycetales bacterium]
MTEPLPWLAPTPREPVVGQIIVPGSKSLTNRALVLAAVAERTRQDRGALGDCGEHECAVGQRLRAGHDDLADHGFTRCG